MADTLDFYFDFSSPYGYIASEKVEALAHKRARSVEWNPILLGVVFKATGAVPLTTVPIKADYARRDFARSARFHGVTGFRLPSRFPIPTQAPARIALWLASHDAPQACDVIHALYRAYFKDDIDISDPDRAAAVAASCGVEESEARAAIDDPAVKDMLRRTNERALAAGVFGSPFVIVDGEPFWGLDRFDQVDRWLATGGF